MNSHSQNRLSGFDGPDPSRDNQKFVGLYSRSYRAIYVYVRAIVGTQGDVDDCMQELSLLLLDKYDPSIPDGDFCHWARGFARNVVRSHRRKTKRSVSIMDDDLLLRIAEVQGSSTEYLDMRREQLGKCLAELPQEDHRLVVQCYVEQVPVKTIATEFRSHVRTIQRALRRIRLTLAKCIDQHLRLVE